MAAVEPLDAADPTDPDRWLVIRGTVPEGDLVPLLEGVHAADRQDAMLDLYHVDSPSADRLLSSGTMGHPHIVFQGSAGGQT